MKRPRKLLRAFSRAQQSNGRFAHLSQNKCCETTVQKDTRAVRDSIIHNGHSIWQFQDDKESCPKAVRVPPNPRGASADRAFCAAPSLRHVEVATGIQHAGVAAWQTCQQLQIVKAPTLGHSLVEGAVYPTRSKGACGVLLPRSSWGQS